MHPLQVREAARAIAHARKPVLYVGGGALNGDACAELLQLAEAGTLPVITTLMGKGAFPETHELHFGWPGMHGPKWSNLAMNTCDVLVAIGARFDDRVTGKLSAFAPGATVVHLDIDPAEISSSGTPTSRSSGRWRRRSRRWPTRSPGSAPRERPRRRRGSARFATGARSSRSGTARATSGSSPSRSSRRSSG